MRSNVGVVPDLTERAVSIPGNEQDVRVQLAACYRLIALYGWDEITFNHVSVRSPGNPHHFLTHRWGLLFDEVKASDLVTLDEDGKIIAGPDGATINPAAFVIHSAVHQAREDINAVVHFHSVASVAVSAQEDGLLPISAGAMFHMDLLAYHDFEGIVLDLEERKRIQTALGSKKKMILLRNHGLLTCGRSIQEAFLLAYFLNRACEIQVAAQSGGVKLIAPPEHIQRRVAVQFQNQDAQPDKRIKLGQLEFSALMRRLDRIDPSYRN